MSIFFLFLIDNFLQLLIVAFDIVLATAVVPLFGCFYAKRPSPRAALSSVVCGALTRIIMEYTLPKDGYLIYGFDEPEFYNYGTAASANFPPVFDQPTELLWNPEVEQCTQEQFKDYTGIDSLTAFGVSIVVFVSIQFLERNGKVLFTLPGMQPYDKMGEIEIRRSELKKSSKEILDDTHQPSVFSNTSNGNVNMKDGDDNDSNEKPGSSEEST